MKGVQLATMTVILIILGVIIFLLFAILLGNANAQVNISQVRESLRYCCSDRGVWNCIDAAATVLCRTPQGTEYLPALAIKANISDAQLRQFCNCPP